ncbi:phosphoesterase [Thermosipho melanesiensis]|uniref:PHP C-terminal domain protein n=2 Tax=Thermosipho melanesiensis TaxID=46541 RepID=A6LKS5_THEM4|nr:PHP domain-containing protein [Thermosipho melanesiensis]ABR30526.1 PHP C-terminal domain protein [Thermosipho melanesiensis BI429]APT73675.1 phosphoesterase [Thermosipho melanesiensis]OOC36748.1 phosphoesterase [Thermosipho melanesiensis]OOC39291.1 phosphoesterase [Thermosipho melanesiensis]OOC39377.1 phosphoesterase [Thermosipho melanesiensis]
MLVDFHLHTTASDGTFSPEDLINLLKEKNIEYFSITDHDTVDGIKNIREKNFIPGVEISVEYPSTLHILGYGIDLNNKKLLETLEMLKQYRLNRNKLIIEKMQKMGFDITFEEALKEANRTIIGRPHFASLMVKKGYVNSIKEAFEKYLKKGKPLYEDKKRLNMDKAIKLIKEANGLSFLAHPYQTTTNKDELETLIKKLVSLGLDGLEVYYSKHTKEMISTYEKIAKKFNLLKSAGSDFHGTNTPDIQPGINIDKKDINDFIKIFF